MVTAFRPLAMALAVASACSAAYAAPWASVPSVNRIGHPAAVQGGGFAAGSMVTVRVTSPTGAVSLAAVMVGADGKLNHTVTPAGAGVYKVEVLDSASKVLSEMRFGTVK